MAHPPTSPYPALSAEAAAQHLSRAREVIAGSDVTRGKFHAGYIRLHPGNG